MIFQETKCVVFTFDTKSKECKLYEDVSGGDVEADAGFIIGFCPKPDPKYAAEIPTSNAKLQWWCYRGKETLCYLPYAPGVFEPLDCGFTNGKCCENSVGHKDFASPCKSQSIITFFCVSFITLHSFHLELIQGKIFAGYPLKNVDGTNEYPGLNVNECAELCEITTYCLYFQHSGKHCYLKYGITEQPLGADSRFRLGYKNIAGTLNC